MLMNSSALVENDYLVTFRVRPRAKRDSRRWSLHVPNEFMNSFSIFRAAADARGPDLYILVHLPIAADKRPSVHGDKGHNYSRWIYDDWVVVAIHYR